MMMSDKDNLIDKIQSLWRLLLKFYTNVQLIGNQFLVRGVENGKRFEIRDDFRPTLFIKTNKESKYKTLSGESVSPIQPGTLRDCRDF